MCSFVKRSDESIDIWCFFGTRRSSSGSSFHFFRGSWILSIKGSWFQCCVDGLDFCEVRGESLFRRLGGQHWLVVEDSENLSSSITFGKFLASISVNNLIKPRLGISSTRVDFQAGSIHWRRERPVVEMVQQWPVV